MSISETTSTLHPIPQGRSPRI